jgi:hypothetical protein
VDAARRFSVSNIIFEHFNKNGPRRRIGEWSEAADIGIPQDGLNTFDRSTFNHTGMNTTAGIAAEARASRSSQIN